MRLRVGVAHCCLLQARMPRMDLLPQQHLHLRAPFIYVAHPVHPQSHRVKAVCDMVLSLNELPEQLDAKLVVPRLSALDQQQSIAELEVSVSLAGLNNLFIGCSHAWKSFCCELCLLCELLIKVAQALPRSRRHERNRQQQRNGVDCALSC